MKHLLKYTPRVLDSQRKALDCGPYPVPRLPAQVTEAY